MKQEGIGKTKMLELNISERKLGMKRDIIKKTKITAEKLRIKRKSWKIKKKNLN